MTRAGADRKHIARRHVRAACEAFVSEASEGLTRHIPARSALQERLPADDWKRASASEEVGEGVGWGECERCGAWQFSPEP
ncbi:hypothetical protein [Haladaptatus caseinilyticus]|uniref:hypothetical protein n=1 Tax=Haladaptatus caseinilyticus TaxID=2993314 RepID=UPI00224B4C44|nr:hypothetical protein [Haladaptatus caseinilyticus]